MRRWLPMSRHVAASSFLLNPTCRRRCRRRFYEDSSWCPLPRRPLTTAVAGEPAMAGRGLSPTVRIARPASHVDRHSTATVKARLGPSRHRSSCRDGRSTRRRESREVELAERSPEASRSFLRWNEHQQTWVDFLQLGYRRVS